MKKKTQISGFFWIAFIFLVSCQPQTQLTNREKEIKAYGFDFRKYSEKGFLFIPNEYFGEYEVLGIINVELHPEVTYKRGQIKTETAHFFDDLNPVDRQITPSPEKGYLHYYFTRGNTLYTQIIAINDLNEILEFIYQTSIDWGGDAFTHFKYTTAISETDDNPNTTYDYDKISGVIIKRK